MQRRQQIPREYRSHTNFSEVWHVGGDAYTAVAVAKKTGTGSWVVYNIFRDHLGTITHLKNGSTIDEYSYDACSVKLRFCKPCETKPLAEHIPKSVAVREGRRRDKDNWSYTLSGEPALFADRGFTGTRSVSSGFGELCEAKTDERTNPAFAALSGKYLEDFDLYNMNGRLYDPVLGRFLSPDPYIADPSFTQSYNRYSYVLNNPLKYNDPTGELPFLAWLGIAWAGNYLMGVADNHINKGMSVKDAFRNTNIVAGVNFSPSDMSRSNNYGVSHNSVDAQKAALHEEEMTAYLTAIERSLSGGGNPARGGGRVWYSIYNWPGLGSSAQTMDALYAGDYLSATGHFLTCAAEVFTFGYASTISFGSKATSVTARSTSQFKYLRGTGGEINGFTISKGSGYGAKPRFDFHKLSNTYNSRATSRMTIPEWLDGKKLPHWHRGKGNNLRYHRPWEIGPDGNRRW